MRKFWVSSYLFVGEHANGDVEWRLSASRRSRGHRLFKRMLRYMDPTSPAIGLKSFIHRYARPPEYITEYSLVTEVTNGRIPNTMAQKTFHIELRCVGVDDEAKFESIKKAARIAAKQLHAQAMLVCAADSPPQIMLYGEDFINGKKEIVQSSKDDEDET